MVLLIAYDQPTTARPARYEAVRQMVRMHADDVRQALYSHWLVETDDPPLEWRDRLVPLIDPDDSLFILPVTDAYCGYLPDDVWPWLEERV